MVPDKKLLYLMHVSWFWIKQRPQFLAEELSEFYQTSVVCLEDHNASREFGKNGKSNLKLLSLRIFKGKSSIISILNFNLRKFQLSRLIKRNSIIWFNSPTQYALAKFALKKDHVVIYDCMDNAAEFYNSEGIQQKVITLERELCKRANLIITSAKSLKLDLENKYSISNKIKVINNALSIKQSDLIEIPKNILQFFEDKSKKYIVYIGTVAIWFNFEDIEYALNNSKITLVIIGPKDCDIPVHPQIKYAGIIEHSLVDEVMKLSDALIMPFKITTLVKGVNPVKAYEYISSGKSVILSKYEEIAVFEDFVYFYESREELASLFSLIETEKLNPKKNKEECLEFAQQNTWQQRAEEIKKLIVEHVA